MMKFLQRLGRSLLLPVATMPIAGFLMGIGYYIDPVKWGGNSLLANLLITAGGIILSNLPVLFAMGVGLGMADESDGTAALSAFLSFKTIETMLAPGIVSAIMGTDAPAAFGKIGNPLTGILAGLVGAYCYNKFRKIEVPEVLGFFGGKRSVPIMSTLFGLLLCIPLYFIWPVVYGALVQFGITVSALGALGAGIFGFFNRLLIPVGLHHALNAVFFFDVAGINDIGKFWGAEGAVRGVTGMYQSGFFPVMMFGLPAAALAMYLTAKPEKRKVAFGLLASAAFCAFLTGVTEPLEFSFMFLAPILYFAHAVLSGIFLAVTAALPARAGFGFSAGAIDLFLSYKNPNAMNLYIIVLLGLVAFVVYFLVFYVLIKALNLKTVGREDDDYDQEVQLELDHSNYAVLAQSILEGLGGKENIARAEHCVTRLRLDVKDRLLVDEAKIKKTGVAGVVRPSKTSVQVIVGPKVQFVYDEFKKLL